MTNENILDLVRRCNLKFGIELIPNESYLFNRNFRIQVSDKARFVNVEIIVLVKNKVKVGGIYRMGHYDMHWVIDEQHQGQHILSDFLRTGIIKEIWTENTSVTLEKTHLRKEYNKKKYLAKLCGMTVRNQKEIERFLSSFRQ